MAPIKAKTLRAESRGKVLQKLAGLRTDLAKLRVAKLAQGGSRAAEIGVARKNIARALTVANQKYRFAQKKIFKGQKFQPKELRVKKTRALRRALNVAERNRKTVRTQKKIANFPRRVFAIKA
jgi:large subunit ribosomal protein L35e